MSWLMVLPESLDAFCLLNTSWPSGRIAMFHNFPDSGLLDNGTSSWSENTVSAMEEWSLVSTGFTFISGGVIAVGQDSFDETNVMVFDDNVAGDPFDPDVLAITFTRADGNDSAFDSDIIFNNAINWNAYDGPLRLDAFGIPVFDFRRVALHELGHVLGLDHPDGACGQNVDAIMNAQTTDTDNLTTDDRSGLLAIYASGNEPPVADAGLDQQGDGSEPFLLDGSNSSDPDGKIEQYFWHLDGNIIAQSETAQITLGLGTHVITLTVIDDFGASDVDELVIIVTRSEPPPVADNTPPVADAGPDQTVDPGEIAVLNGLGSTDGGTIVEFVWSQGTTVIGRQPVMHVALLAGAHEITLTVFDDAGDSDSDTVIITVGQTGDTGDDTFNDDSSTQMDPADDPTMETGAPCGAMGTVSLIMMSFACYCLRGATITRRKVR